MKILIVEDEILIAKSLSKLLIKKGCQVDCVSNGTDAIQKILNETYDRIVCDLMLEDITGFDVIEECKQKYALKEIQSLFIIITAYTSSQILERAKLYKCPILGKPFQDLHQTIETILTGVQDA